jgi:hypothetical protein
MKRSNLWILLVFLGTLPQLVAAQPDYDFDWVTIGHPRNRDTIESEVPYEPGLRIGGVDHKYRLTRTEVTVSQWFEFVNAYAPYWDGALNDSDFTGVWISAKNNDPENPEYQMVPGSESFPTNMSWHVAARYVNWLHNGKGGQEADFESGVYDTSTFTENGDGTWNDQREHSPDALFWIPTLDEWTKGMYYDANRYGPGQEGYWTYPDGGEDPLTPGWPWDGGETSAGIKHDEGAPYLDVGSYPWVTSPWGLMDGSGGETEWVEDMSVGGWSRLAKATSQFGAYPEYSDRLGIIGGSDPGFSGFGLRLASTIPAPHTGFIVVPVLCFQWRRR